MSNNSNHHDNDKDIDLNVDIDQDFKFKLDQETKLDVETENKTKSEYEIKVDAPKYSKVDVDIDVRENKEIREKHEIKFEEYVRKDVDIDINENVNKNVDISVWNTEVNVHAKNIIQNATIYTEHDEDVNDIDSSKLINVARGGSLEMDDFTARQNAVGGSFNGKGNDAQYSVRQSNQLVDKDELIAPQVLYEASRQHGKDDKHDKDGRGEHGKDSSDPFQKVKAEGGRATADDGIDGDVKDSAKGNDGDGSIAGSAAASADGIANVSAFTQDIVMGANTQGNFTTLNVTGGNWTDADNIDAGRGHGGGGHGDDDEHDGGGHGSGGGGGHGDGGLAIRDSSVTEIFDDDINDLDSDKLLNVYGELDLDDFVLDTTAVGNSFNGAGNDMQFDVGQVNDLVDNDSLCKPLVKYDGPGGSPFQEVSAYGGHAQSGDGIHGKIDGSGNFNGNNGSISGSTSASADAIANVSAFTQNIVMGANLQVNNFTATVVGGDATTADDIGL